MTESAGSPQSSDHPRYDGSAVIIGAGSVGSYLAAKLAKAGFRSLHLLDRDVLERKNVPRHYLGADDVGEPKALALAHRLTQQVDSCVVEGEYCDFLLLPEDEQIAYLNQARDGIVVAATDSIDCQLRINQICVEQGIPAIYPGIGIWPEEVVRHGEVGHILPVVPGEDTPCFQCYTAWRPQGNTGGGSAPGRGGPGLDIDYFSAVVAWAIIGLFYPDDPHAEIFDPARPLTLVHSLSRISPSVQEYFEHGNIANFEISFPPTPCPVCGGHEAPPLQLPLPPPVPRPPRPPIPTPLPQPPVRPGLRKGWLYAVLAALLLITVIVVLVHNGSSTSGGQQSAIGTGGQSGSSSSGLGLPETASTAFNVTPSFAAKSATVSGPAGDSAGDNFSVSLTPSLNGFTLSVTVQATYDPSQYTAGTPASTMFGQSCMDITGPTTQDGMAGLTYREPPLSANLTDSGGTITGTLEYAAVLPGSYGFDYACLGVNAGQNPIDVGSVTTNNLGISDGYQGGVGPEGNGNNGNDDYNAMTVFAEEKSATDTVILFGAVGTSQDSLQPSSNSCIIYNPPPQDPTIAHPASISVSEQKQSNGQWYEVGTLTFNLSASQISNGTPAYDAGFYYNCGGGQSTSGVIDRGGGVDLH